MEAGERNEQNKPRSERRRTKRKRRKEQDVVSGTGIRAGGGEGEGGDESY